MTDTDAPAHDNERNAGLTFDAVHGELMQSIIAAQSKLATLTVEDNGPLSKACDDTSRTVELTRSGSNCMHCDRPLTQQGYLFPHVRAVLEDMGVDLQIAYAKLSRSFPLPTRRWGMPCGAHAVGQPAEVTMDFCSPQCVEAHIVTLGGPYKSQRIADNHVQALKAGIRDVRPAPPRAFMDRHGGLEGFRLEESCADEADAHVVVTQLFETPFKRVAPAFCVHSVRPNMSRVTGTFTAYADERNAQTAYERGDFSGLAGSPAQPLTASSTLNDSEGDAHAHGGARKKKRGDVTDNDTR